MIYVEYFKDWLCGNTRASPLSKTPMEEQTVDSACYLPIRIQPSTKSIKVQLHIEIQTQIQKHIQIQMLKE